MSSFRMLAATSLSAAVLWVGIGALGILARPLPRLPSVLAGLVLPPTLPTAVWFAPPAGAVGVAVLAGALFAGVLALLLQVLVRGRSGRFLAAWLAVILTGFAATGLTAASLLLPEIGTMGAASTASNVVQTAESAGYWGLLWGWLPALIGLRVDRPVPEGARRRPGLLAAAALTVVAGGALLLVAYPATRTPPPPPVAVSPPVPSPSITAYGWSRIPPSPSPAPAGSCAPEDLTVALGNGDAATGHRQLPIRATNAGSRSCVLDGYPDVVFDDAAGNAMDVLVVHGGSFMTQDPGAKRIRLQPGEVAMVQLGWNAQSAAGEQRAARVYVSVRPGDPRVPLPTDLDIKDGGSVALSAWQRAPTVEPPPD